MKQWQDLLQQVLAYNTLDDGSLLTHQTRSGEVVRDFDYNLRFNLQEGFPAVTTKKLQYGAVVGELLWFLAGKTDLDSLREYSNIPEGDWTIWTQDAERFGGEGNKDLGAIYGSQWRNFGGDRYAVGTDQILKLINGLKEDPLSRYHVVSAWNPNVLHEIALPSCHMFFQCFVDIDEYGYKHLDLKWYQRSVDSFLGLPFNIASYATLLVILAKLTGCTPRYLCGSLGDTHIYKQHLDQVSTVINRKPYEACGLVHRHFTDLDSLLGLTAKDFNLVNYRHYGVVKGRLTVGAENEGQSPEVT